MQNLFRKFLTICFGYLLFSPVALQAQASRIGLKGGLSFPSLSSNSDNELSDGYESRLDVTFGLIFEKGITEHFSIKTGLDYSGQGGVRNGLQILPAIPPAFSQMLPPGTKLYANFENESILKYLEVPVLAKYEWGKKWKYYVNAGPYFGYLIKATQETSGTSGIYLDNKGTIPLAIQGQPIPPISFNASTDVKDKLNTFNFGLTGGIGLAHGLGKQGEMLFDVRGAYGLTTLQKDKANGENHTGGLFVTLGYVRLLKSK